MGVHRAIRGQGQVDDTAYVDPSAYVSSSALISTKAFVDRGAFIGDTAYIGLRTIVGAGAHIGAGAFIGADCIICDKARIADAAVIVDGSTVLSDCCCDGGGSGGQDVPVLTFDSINVVGDKLAAYITTGKKKGTLAYVGNDSFAGQFSVKAYFVLVYGENLTADGLTVVNSPTFGTDGAQWLRQDTANEQAWAARFWAIDETNGNDENTGWGANQAAADLVPLKTMAELNRRLYGQIIGDGVTVVFHQLTNITAPQILTNVQLKGSGYALWLGSKTLLFSGAVTTYAAANPAANTASQLNIASIPVSWTASGILRKLIESGDGLRCAWATADLGGQTARITIPCNSSAVSKTVASTASVFTPGETVNIVSLTTMPIWPFNSDNVLNCGSQYCDFTINASGTSRNDLGDSTPIIARCSFQTTVWKGRLSNFDGVRITGCLFDQIGFGTIFAGRYTVGFCGAVGRSGAAIVLTIQASIFGLNAGGILFENCGIALSGNSICTASSSHTAFFNYAGTMIGLDSDCVWRYNNVSFLYGSGNSGFLVVLNKNSIKMLVPPLANITAATSTAAEMNVGGVSYNRASIPIVDLNCLSSISFE